jgi:hypothetical protein
MTGRLRAMNLLPRSRDYFPKKADLLADQIRSRGEKDNRCGKVAQEAGWDSWARGGIWKRQKDGKTESQSAALARRSGQLIRVIQPRLSRANKMDQLHKVSTAFLPKIPTSAAGFWERQATLMGSTTRPRLHELFTR